MSCCLILFAPQESTFTNRLKKDCVRTELSSPGSAKYKSSPAWKCLRWFQEYLCLRGLAIHVKWNLFHCCIFFLWPSAIECWISSPDPMSRPNTESIQRTQLLLLSLYYSVRPLSTIASCLHTTSLALAEKIWKAVVLLHHSHYPRCHLRLQYNIIPMACSATALMGHSFTWYSCTRGSWLSD